MLALQSQLLSEVLSSVPCCNTTALSLPFNSVVVKNLLAIISCGVSLPLARDDLLNVKVAADLLDITLGQLEVEKSEVQTTKKARVKKKKIAKEVVASSPKPYLQNDNDNDSDEIVEITPEIYGDGDTGAIPPHFLMQVGYYDFLLKISVRHSDDLPDRRNTWRTQTPGPPRPSRSRS